MMELILRPSFLDENCHEIIIKEDGMLSIMEVCEFSELKDYAIQMEMACIQLRNYIQEHS